MLKRTLASSRKFFIGFGFEFCGNDAVYSFGWSSSSSSSIYSPLTNKQSSTQSKEWQVTRET